MKEQWQALRRKITPPVDESPIPLSVIIPTYNVAHTIRPTLESLKAQTHPDTEVVVIDAGSTDPTLDVITRAYRGKLRIYSVATFHLADMYNRGVSLAENPYVGFLFPGDTYLLPNTLQLVSSAIQAGEDPDLLYGGCLLRSAQRKPRVLMASFADHLLERGRQPMSLQACFLKMTTLRRLGKFDAAYQWRAPLDLLCRIYHSSDLRSLPLDRVIVDHERRRWGPQMLLRRAYETQHIVKKHFGTRAQLRWWLAANPWRFFRMWWRSRHL